MSISVFEQIKALDTHVNGIVSAFDIDALMPDERKILALIKRQLTDTRLDVRDYEYADTRAEQQRYAKTAHKTLDAVQSTLLQASEHNLFGAIDIAHISAQIQHIKEQLQ